MRRRPRPHDDPEPAAAAAPGEAGQRSAAVGRDNTGIIATGDSSVNVQYQAEHMTALPAEALKPAAGIKAPPNLTNLPQRTGSFVGRAAELARLSAALADRDGALRGTVVQALHGLGGIGKSTLAAHYALTHRQDFSVIWWITADSPTQIDRGLAALATALRPGLAGQLPDEALRELAVQWLASHDQWLVVLDNVTNPADVQGLLAQADSGRFVITSRRSSGWHGIATPVRLGVLTGDEARQLLTAILTHGRDPGPHLLDGADVLCEELGYLPLAIEQAGAYIAETGITPVSYLRLLADYPAAMYQETAAGGDAQRAVARIWRVTLDQLADTPHAGQLLRVLAFYAPDRIPRYLLNGLADPQQLATAIGRLTAYSMITANDRSLAVHRLVQAVARTADPNDPHRTEAAIEEGRRQAAVLLADAGPRAWPDEDDPRQDPREMGSPWHALRPHVEALAERTTPDADTYEITLLLEWAGREAREEMTRPPGFGGNLARAIPLFDRALAGRARVLGEEHPVTLSCRDNIAVAYLEAGGMPAAIPVLVRNLKHLARVRGYHDFRTICCCYNLAVAYRAVGRKPRLKDFACWRLGDEYFEAISLGQYDPAGPRTSAQDLARAITLYEHALRGFMGVLGEDGDLTRRCRRDLADSYQEAGDSARAIPLLERMLEESSSGQGGKDQGKGESDKPQAQTGVMYPAFTVFRTVRLGHTRTGKYLYTYGTVADFARGVEDSRLRALGLGLRIKLADAYRAAGDLARATALYESTLADCTRVLGEDHRWTLTIANKLAETYQAAGDLARATALYESTLADCTRLLSEDDALTVAVRQNLAQVK